MHEYTHLVENDILLKFLINILCGIYWWNPFIYILKKDLEQSMEIRCDLSVTKYLNENERADYLAVMLETFKEQSEEKYVSIAGLVEKYSGNLPERFKIVADNEIDKALYNEKHEKVFVGFIMLFVFMISYSFIIQSKFEAPISDIETDENIYQVDKENAYIIKQDDVYILHSAETRAIITEETVNMLLEEGFILVDEVTK